MISLLLKFGSLSLSVLRYGVASFLRFISFLRQGWQLAAGNTRKLIVAIPLTALLLVTCLRSCNDYKQRVVKQYSSSILRASTNGLASRTRTVIAKALDNRLNNSKSILRSNSEAGATDFRWTHGIGAEVFYKGCGADIGLFQYKDFGGQIGFAYFPKEERLDWSVGGHYNIHKLTKEWTKNTSIFVSYTPHTIIGGIRVAL